MNYMRMVDLVISLCLISCASWIATACTNHGSITSMDEITAQVVLKASNGVSILDPDPGLVVIDQQIIDAASEKLRALGCDVLSPGVHSLSISCNIQVFEKAFKTSLVRKESPSAAVRESFFQYGQPVTIPDELKPFVADVILSVPPELDL